jgi:hypothetical protein
VLVDGTCTTEYSIRDMFKIDEHAQHLLVNTPLNICKERAIATNQPDLLPVIDRMDQQLSQWKEDHVNYIEGLRRDFISKKTTKQMSTT